MAKRVAFDTQPLLSRKERLKRRRDLAVAPVGKSVLKISVCFYLGALIVVLTAGIALWEVARVAGVIDSVQHFMRQLLGSNDFTVLSWRVLRGFTLLGLVMVMSASSTVA